MAVKQLWPSPPQFVDANGDPYSGALLFFYASGSSTKQNAYTDSTGNTACSNPTTLNSSGYPANSGTIFTPFGTVGQTYKIGLAAPGASDPPASFIWTADNIAPTNDVSVSQDQWVSGPAPTYISATSFSLVGDQTTEFHVGRRLKTTNSGGTVYSTITASAYAAATTVTVVNDSGSLDAGLSAVYYGLLSATNPSTPLLADTYPIVSGSADKTKKLRFEVDGLTTGTTRVITVPDADLTLNVIGAAAGNASDSAAGVIEVAVQSEQETGTSTTLAVTPGRQQYHASAAKAWVKFNGTGTVAINASYNVTSITDNGTGDYTVNFTTAFSSGEYAFSVAAGDTGVTLGIMQWVSQAVGAFRFTVGSAAPTAQDSGRVSCIFFGDQ